MEGQEKGTSVSVRNIETGYTGSMTTLEYNKVVASSIGHKYIVVSKRDAPADLPELPTTPKK